MKIAIAQIATYPGQLQSNQKKIIDSIEEAKARGAELVVFPEGCIPGYSSMDLLYNPSYIEDNLAVLQKVASSCNEISAIVGYVDQDRSLQRAGKRPALYNSAAFISDKKILGKQDKTLLPNYNIFFEDRYFEPARTYQVFKAAKKKIGIQICEDLWVEGYGIDPAEKLAEKNAELICNISASPFHIGRQLERLDQLQRASQKHSLPQVYVNLVGCYDGFEGEVVFDGRSCVLDAAGKLLHQSPAFEEDIAVIDIDTAPAAKIEQLSEDEELLHALTLGIREYFWRMKTAIGSGLERVIVGLSGGVDSALVAALAVRALGPERVLGLSLPSRFNSAETRSDAEKLASLLDISLETLSIEESYEGILGSLESCKSFGDPSQGTTSENIQARLRMIYLMAFANQKRAIVLNTGNKTEMALNNCTIYGDMVGGFSVLGDVDKDRVYSLARHMNQIAGKRVIPETILERIPTAELRENQNDAMVMGADPQVIAPLVRAIVEERLSVNMALDRFQNSFPESLIRSTFQKLDASEWKRRQAAPCIRVTPLAFGNGRKMPISHGYWS